MSPEVLFPLTSNGGGGGAQVPADWNENDPSSKAYIQNRTHYKEIEETNNPVLSCEVENASSVINKDPQIPIDPNVFQATYDETLTDGLSLGCETHNLVNNPFQGKTVDSILDLQLRIILDGTSYVGKFIRIPDVPGPKYGYVKAFAIGKLDDDTLSNLSSESAEKYSEYGYSDWPVMICVTEADNGIIDPEWAKIIIVPFDSSNPGHTIQISEYKVEEIYHKLDRNYVGIPDWNESNQGSESYIKNRTHYEIDNDLENAGILNVSKEIDIETGEYNYIRDYQGSGSDVTPWGMNYYIPSDVEEESGVCIYTQFYVDELDEEAYDPNHPYTPLLKLTSIENLNVSLHYLTTDSQSNTNENTFEGKVNYISDINAWVFGNPAVIPEASGMEFPNIPAYVEDWPVAILFNLSNNKITDFIVYSGDLDQIYWSFTPSFSEYGIKKLDAKYLNIADWNEGDPNSAAYIKNKTHYDISAIKFNELEFATTIISPYDSSESVEIEYDDDRYSIYCDGIYDDPDNYEFYIDPIDSEAYPWLIEGKLNVDNLTCTMTENGQTYSGKVYVIDESSYEDETYYELGFGNPDIIGSQVDPGIIPAEQLEFPFYVYFEYLKSPYGDGVSWFNVNYPYSSDIHDVKLTHSLKIEEKQFKKLDGKYLTNSDWNDDDPNSAAHIKNRTHYDTRIEQFNDTYTLAINNDPETGDSFVVVTDLDAKYSYEAGDAEIAGTEFSYSNGDAIFPEGFDYSKLSCSYTRNGVTYTGTFSSADEWWPTPGCYYFGSSIYDFDASHTFCILLHGETDRYRLYVANYHVGSSPESISLNISSGALLQLNEKYIPNTIARTSDVPELWEIGKASYKPTASTPCVSFQDVKCNGVLFNGSLSTYVTVIKNGIVVNMMALSTQSATTFINGAFDAPLSSSQINFIKQYADTILFRLGTDNGARILNATFLLPLRAASIAANENGFVTGDQVNTVVGNIETLLASI